MTDADCCAEIARRNARTFTLAAAMLPREKRRGVFALYAFCRVADDIVDQGDASAAAQLDAHRRALDATLDGSPAGPLFRELGWTVARFGVPAAPLRGVLDGVAHDLSPARYATWGDLREYSASVASTVGEMCTHVFGVDGGPEALACALGRARYLGLAMQLTNILRDVGEDAARGRCYVPDEDLAAHGLSREELLSTPPVAGDERWRALMRFEIARARALYDEATPGIDLLARDARRCATACAHGYAAILDAIERQAYDTIRTRAVVPTWRKASVLWGAWRLRTTSGELRTANGELRT